jgi:hypothetical protein
MRSEQVQARHQTKEAVTLVEDVILAALSFAADLRSRTPRFRLPTSTASEAMKSAFGVKKCHSLRRGAGTVRGFK